MKIAKDAHAKEPIGEVTGPDEAGKYWCQSSAMKVKQGPHKSSRLALEHLLKMTGNLTSFYIDGGMKQSIRVK